MPASSQQLRRVSWNHIQCSAPITWQAIVKDHSHLIFEKDLSPILEIRWHRPGKKTSPEKQTEKVIARLKKKSDGSMAPMLYHSFLKTISPDYLVTPFGNNSDKKPTGTILFCRNCGMLIVTHFFPGSFSATEELELFFQNIACHPDSENNRLWAIQDFSFTVPASFTLETFSFSLGLSKISFNSKHTYLRLCRIAQASEQLNKASFSELFSQFSGSSPHDHQPIEKSVLLFSPTPSLKDKFLGRLMKKKSYRWAYFNHIPDFDRIIGASLESSAPLQPALIDTIRSSYNIV